MTHRATREDTIQSIYISLSSSPLDFSPTISFPSVVQPRIEFRPSPPFTSGNKCTYDSIMRVARNRGRAKILAEERVQLSTFHFQRYTSGTPTGEKSNENRSRNRSERLFYLFRTSKYLSFFSFFSPLLFPCYPLPPPFLFLFPFTRNHVQSPLLPWTFLRDLGAGVPRRRFPEEISNGLTVLVSFSTEREIASAHGHHPPSSFPLFLAPIFFDFTLFSRSHNLFSFRCAGMDKDDARRPGWNRGL